MYDPQTRTRILDTNTRYLGIRTIDLMEKAGEGIAKCLIADYAKCKIFTFVCGLGNNGGDGLVAARYLTEYKDKNIVVYLIGRESEIKTEESRKNFQILHKLQKDRRNLDIIQDASVQNIDKTDVIVECLIGTGIHGKLHKRYSDIVKKLSKMSAHNVSIDFPISGYKYDRVYSLHFQKVKDSKVIDIGIPQEAEQYVGPGEVKELYIPADESYKSQNGELFVFGGSDTYHGAPLMAMKTASKFIGSVFFYSTPGNRELLKTLKSELCEFINVGDNDVEKYAGYADAFLIGPGLIDDAINRAMIKSLFDMYPEKPKIIDAYAIAMAPKDKLQNCILTPHRGELRHIWGDKTKYNMQRLEGNIRRFAKESGAIIVLKGHVTTIFNNNGEVKFSRTGNAGMAKGGTGDILAGLMGALLTKNDPWLAAQSAVFLNGLAGDEAYKDFGYSYSATDIIPYHQKAMKWCRDF